MADSYDSNVPSAELVARAHALSSVSDARLLYNDWAKTYDFHMQQEDYASPQRAVDLTIKYIEAGERNLQILDAGCGTGLVGEFLSKSPLSSVMQVDGLDLSQGMLAAARDKNIYRHLKEADLSQPLELDHNTYDIVLCVGTLTKGHVGPHAISEFAKVATKGGLIVFTVLNDVWNSLGYNAEVEKLVGDRIVAVKTIEDFGIKEGNDTGGKLAVLQKI